MKTTTSWLVLNSKFMQFFMANCQFRITARGDIIRTTWALRSEAINSCKTYQGPAEMKVLVLYTSTVLPWWSWRSVNAFYFIRTRTVWSKKWSFVDLIRLHFESKFSIQITSTAGCPKVTCLVSIFRKSIFFFRIFDFCSLLVTASDQDQFDKINFQLSNKVIHIKIRHT